MKNRIMMRGFFVLIVLVLFASNAYAFGLGVYGSTGSGSAEWDKEYWDGSSFTYDKDSEHSTFGFVMDTAVAKNTLFNYRLSVGSAKVEHEPGDCCATYELKGIVFENDFGFGIIRKEKFRLWVGPELRIGFYEGEIKNSPVDIDLVEVGLGPVIGANFHLGPVVTLSLKAGHLATEAFGEQSGGLADADLDVSGSHSFVNFALIFRLDDNY